VLWLNSLRTAGRVRGRTRLLLGLNRLRTGSLALLLRTSCLVMRLLVVLLVALLVVRLGFVVWLSAVVWVGALRMSFVIRLIAMRMRVVIWVGALWVSLVIWLISVGVRVVILRVRVMVLWVSAMIIIVWAISARTAVMVTRTAVMVRTTMVVTTTSGTRTLTLGISTGVRLINIFTADWLDGAVLPAVLSATHDSMRHVVRTLVFIVWHLSLRMVAGGTFVVVGHVTLIRVVAAVRWAAWVGAVGVWGVARLGLRVVSCDDGSQGQDGKGRQLGGVHS